MGLAARFRGPGLWIYWSVSIAICTLHIWIDESPARGGEGRLGTDSQTSGFSGISRGGTGRVASRRETRQDGNKKQETRQEAEARYWLTGRLQVWQIRTQCLACLPYCPTLPALP